MEAIRNYNIHTLYFFSLCLFPVFPPHLFLRFFSTFLTKKNFFLLLFNTAHEVRKEWRIHTPTYKKKKNGSPSTWFLVDGASDVTRVIRAGIRWTFSWPCILLIGAGDPLPISSSTSSSFFTSLSLLSQTWRYHQGRPHDITCYDTIPPITTTITTTTTLPTKWEMWMSSQSMVSILLGWCDRRDLGILIICSRSTARAVYQCLKRDSSPLRPYYSPFLLQSFTDDNDDVVDADNINKRACRILHCLESSRWHRNTLSDHSRLGLYYISERGWPTSWLTHIDVVIDMLHTLNTVYRPLLENCLLITLVLTSPMPCVDLCTLFLLYVPFLLPQEWKVYRGWWSILSFIGLWFCQVYHPVWDTME